MSGDELHYSDKWKTPYSTEGFNTQSQYALPNAPHWKYGAGPLSQSPLNYTVTQQGDADVVPMNYPQFRGVLDNPGG